MAKCLRSLAFALLALCTSLAGATYHTYQIEEIYSNVDGTVQYVVLHESLGMPGQNELTGQALTSTAPAGTTTFNFPRDLPGGSCDYYGQCTPSPTANTRVLIATQGFVALGLVTPDYVIPNGFLARGGGTLNYAGVDQWTYGPLPSDGVSALYRSGSVKANLATNFNYQSVSVTLPGPVTWNSQGLWWAAPANSESGWGINFAHQADTIFATWFTYDVNGRGWWLVMTAPKTSPNGYSGTLYQTRGPPFNAQPFSPANVTSTPVGSGTLSFSDANNGMFDYTVNGVHQTKAITRQVFGPLPTCTFGGLTNLALATNYQDLWWAAPAASESGWGINLNHEGDTIFATWFTYDLDGTPMWLVVTAPKTGPAVYTGDLYRTAGARFDAFDATRVVPTKVGTATFTFADGNTATFAYSITGVGPNLVTQTKTITREIFAAPGTVCQ